MLLLQNDTILLRAMEPDDLESLYNWENDSTLWRYGITLAPYSKFTLSDFIAHANQDIFQSRQLRLMIEEKADCQTIGTIDLCNFDPMNLRAEVGIFLDAAYRNQGFGTQTLHLIKEYAFCFLMLKQLYAYVPKNNLPSCKLFRKSNYQKAGLLQSWIKTEKGFKDVYLMQILNENIITI